MPRRTVPCLAALLGAVLVLSFAVPAAAQWKWRDKSGHTQYSDLPPPSGIADKDILARPGAAVRAPVAPNAANAANAASAASAPASAANRIEPELDARRKAAEQAEAERKKADEARLAATKAENCSRARDQLRTLDSGIRISRVNPRGEREVLDDAARAEETRRARDTVGADCR